MDELRKIDRKKKRFAVRLKNKGIECTDAHGSSVVLCNVGQATGFKKDDLSAMLQKISPSPKVIKFIAEKGDSHSFVVFDTTSDAEIFIHTYDGVSQGEKNSVPIYMNFVKTVPNNELICPSSNPKGLTIIEDFITKEEEETLYQLFDWTDESALKNRQVKHYGYEFRYGSNDVDLNNPLADKIPQKCEFFWIRLKSYGIDFGTPDQLTVNKYSPGQGIPSHVDKHSPFGDTILSLSLNSSVVMDWKHHSQQYVPVVVPARSLLVMQGEARYDWQHGIQPRNWDPIIELRNSNNKLIKVVTSDTKERQTRISLTFRTTRSGPCECAYKTLCDKASKDLDEVASSLEELHVHQVYEQIAGHFSSTRHKPWPKVVEFLQNIQAGSVIIDLGAGNGKNILNRNDLLQIAYEYSMGLLWECASSTHAQCVRGDVLRAPLRDHCADAAICIAVLHHLSTHARRVQAISTIARLLRPGGRALITVWAKDQSKSNYLCKDREEENSDSNIYSTVGINLPVHQNRTQFRHNDVLVPWKLRKVKENKLENQASETLLRYYHVFEEGELDKLCDLPSLVIEKSFYEEGNWCVICKKI